MVHVCNPISRYFEQINCLIYINVLSELFVGNNVVISVRVYLTLNKDYYLKMSLNDMDRCLYGYMTHLTDTKCLNTDEKIGTVPLKPIVFLLVALIP